MIINVHWACAFWCKQEADCVLSGQFLNYSKYNEQGRKIPDDTILSENTSIAMSVSLFSNCLINVCLCLVSKYNINKQ